MIILSLSQSCQRRHCQSVSQSVADGQMDRQTDGRTDRQTDGRTDGQTDRRTDGRYQTYNLTCFTVDNNLGSLELQRTLVKYSIATNMSKYVPVSWSIDRPHLNIIINITLHRFPFITRLPRHPEADLLDYLKRKTNYYGTAARPILDGQKKLTVRYGLRLIRLEVDEGNNVLTTSVWIRQVSLLNMYYANFWLYLFFSYF